MKLLIAGREVGAGRVERTVPLGYSAEGLDIGMDNMSAVSPDYKAPFAFSGTIRSVTIAIRKRVATARRSSRTNRERRAIPTAWRSSSPPGCGDRDEDRATVFRCRIPPWVPSAANRHREGASYMPTYR